MTTKLPPGAMTAADYLAKVEADPKRAAALERARQRAKLPEPVAHVHSNGDFCADRAITSEAWPVNLYTEAQLRQVRREALEEAARVCDEFSFGTVPPIIAEAIRALKENSRGR